jgi:hypothetical protein
MISIMLVVRAIDEVYGGRPVSANYATSGCLLPFDLSSNCFTSWANGDNFMIAVSKISLISAVFTLIVWSQ